MVSVFILAHPQAHGGQDCAHLEASLPLPGTQQTLNQTW